MHLCGTCAVWTGAPPAISAISNSINNCNQRYLRRDACSVDWRPAWLRSPWIASTGCGVCALRLRASSSAAAFARTRTQVNTHARGSVWGPGQSYLGRYKHEDSALLQKVRQTLREPRPFQVSRLQHLDHLQSLITISNQQRQSVSSKVVSALGA